MPQPVLILLDLSKPFEIHCDGYGDCLGVILLQGVVLLQDGHAIAYEICQLHEKERVLKIYEKELLAIIGALSSWEHYLLGTPFASFKWITKASGTL